MALPMQGDELLPRHQHVVGRGLAPRTPDRGGGDRLLDALRELAQAAAVELGGHGLAVARPAVGKDVDQLAPHPGGLGVAELDPGELLEVLVQQPGVIDGGLEDERLAQRNAVAAVDRARRQLGAGDHVGLVQGANSEWRMASRWRIGSNGTAGLAFPIRHSPFAIRLASPIAARRAPTGPRPPPGALLEQLPQPVAELAAIISA